MRHAQGNCESFEPYTQNLYVRRVLSGEFVQVNRHLLRDLIERKLWTEELRMQLIAHNGSVQHLNLPQEIKDFGMCGGPAPSGGSLCRGR